MSLRKDKQKVLGETFDDERIKTFLQLQPSDDLDADFHVLEKAYRGMKADNFTTFLKFFLESGRNINATNQDGKTFLQVVKHHRLAEDYVTALTAAGAK
ncbi:hypothetical protein FKG94_10845 [Exilibacterium tricleocarpae]|uniref:Uncharacterized protein n=1 Tax=Exilibacterium tricleocarpae TaxID=2591008 RepID=A0A545TSG4_9GAMM|nr:PA4642 family protein [Exilibacterium tricleocarpae]TQV80157.1 hypothetical protein FKG94_10845 [Exilibacterium tricleocarpae]